MSNEKAIRDNAKKEMIDEINALNRFIFANCRVIDKDFYILSCGDLVVLREIYHQFEAIKAKYREHKFSYDRYMPHVDVAHYDFIRYSAQPTFSSMHLKDGDARLLFANKNQHDIDQLKKRLAECITDEVNRDLFMNDLWGLRLDCFCENDIYNYRLIASKCDFTMRYESGRHLLAYARKTSESPQIKFRANCIVGEIDNVEKITKKAVKVRKDAKRHNALMVLEDGFFVFNGKKSKHVEFHIYDGESTVQTVDEVEIYI